MIDDPKALKLFQEVLEKTTAGRIRWEPTAEENLFIAPIGGQFTLALSKYVTATGAIDVGLTLKDKERELVRVTPDVKGVSISGFLELFEGASRQANRVDEKIDKVLGELQKL